MQSMTGHATKTVFLKKNDNEATVTINLKSLNSKFFESTCKLHPVLQSFEGEVYKLLKSYLIRGSIYCSIQIDNPAFFQEEITASLSTAKAYYKSLSEIKSALNLPGEIDLMHLVRMPNLFVTKENFLDEEQTKKLLDGVTSCIKMLLEIRNLEGNQLKNDILNRLSIAQHELKKIEPLFAARIVQQKKVVQEGLEAIKGEENLLANAQKTALYTMLDKLDLQEEITRFQGHVTLVIQTIESGAAEQGKKLDFLLQELMRETNTILSKCNDKEISMHAINIKVELEKIREQIQNIL